MAGRRGEGGHGGGWRELGTAPIVIRGQDQAATEVNENKTTCSH